MNKSKQKMNAEKKISNYNLKRNQEKRIIKMLI